MIQRTKSGALLSLASAVALSAFGCSSDDTTEGEPRELTFYQDVMPIFNEKCNHCHQEEGIAPFALDNYETTVEWSREIAIAVEARIMPPFLMKTGGRHGVFDESETLSEGEIDKIVAWTESEMLEGEPEDFDLPALPELPGATDIVLPEIVPEIAGGEYALYDEYRCFLAQPDPGEDRFISGYNIIPGNPRMVHHVVGFTIDEDSVAQAQELDDETPDRPGWPCFGAAGEGIDFTGIPITWAPGQGVVEYPDRAGVKFAEGEAVVVQVHYNMADPEVIGQSDQTTVQLRFENESTLNRQATLLLPDPLLESVFGGEPIELEPGQASVVIDWTKTGLDLFDPFEEYPFLSLELLAYMPHMHEYGREMTLELETPDGDRSIIGYTPRWDFNWQKLYHYAEYPEILVDSKLHGSCVFDTRAADEPVAAGWGTRNEMCLATILVALPPGVFF